MFRATLVAAAVLLQVTITYGHVRFVCPRGDSADSLIKQGPCGGSNTFEGNYIEVTPGPFTFFFEEPIFHRRAPTQVGLGVVGDDDAHCVLLDQVPHNDHNPRPKNCPRRAYPVGGCDTSRTYLTVNIPDIRCDRCFLHVVSIMIDIYGPGRVCKGTGIKANDCVSYYTCANIKIRPTAAGMSRGISSCSNYTANLLGTWPYLPQPDPATPGQQIYEFQTTKRLGLDYTPRGFLRGPDFVGESAGDMWGAEPVGPCAPLQQTCAAYIELAPGITAAVAIAVLDTRMRVTAVVAGTVSEATIDVTGLATSSTQNYKFTTTNQIFDETRQLSSMIAGSLAGSTMISVAVGPDTKLVSCADERFVRLTSVGSVATRGLFVYSPAPDGLHTRYVVPAAQQQTASLVGPVRSTDMDNSKVVATLLRDPAAQGAAYYGNTTLMVTSAEVLHGLWRGWTYAHVGGFSAMIPPLNKEFCEGTSSIVCQVLYVSADGLPVPQGLATLAPDGLAAYTLTSGIDVHVSVARLPSASSMSRLVLSNALEGSDAASITLTPRPTPLDSTMQEASGVASMSGGLLEALKNMSVWAELHASSGGMYVGGTVTAEVTTTPTTPATTTTTTTTPSDDAMKTATSTTDSTTSAATAAAGHLLQCILVGAVLSLRCLFP